MQAGLALLTQLTDASKPKPAGGAESAGGLVQSLVRRDEQTGEQYLKLPVPPPDVLEQALRAVGGLLESLRR